MSRDPVKTVFNYPPVIIERCRQLGLVDDKHCVIKGTEDMEKDYHDYWFHIRGSLIGMLLAIPSALIAGLIVII